MKRYYDRNTNFIEHNVDDAVWYSYVEKRAGISPKLARKCSEVIYQIQLYPRGKPKLVHYDKLKTYQGDKKPSWFRVASG